METVWVRAKSKQYPIFIAESLLENLDKKALSPYSSFYLITDNTVAPLYLEQVTQVFAADAPVHHAIVPSGEASKSFEVYKQLLDQLMELNLDRNACVLALGGGVIGDLAGFVAATYLRGIGFIQLPTTLLAHDSSVGGKVGINHEKGKNLIGAFYHPDAVLYHTAFLSSLPKREWRSGFSELIKHSLLDSLDFFDDLKHVVSSDQDLTPQKITPYLKRGIEVKARVVEADETEQGQRAFLNFGHTLGHALEKTVGYGVLTHGEAIAIGMLFALKLSEVWFNHKLPTDALTEWLLALHLPIIVPKDCDLNKLLASMKRDKKRKGETIRFVLLEVIGKPRLVEMPDAFIKEQLSEFMKM